MSAIESQGPLLDNAFPNDKSSGHQEEQTRDKIKDARPCG
jgi:hypothetical protein